MLPYKERKLNYIRRVKTLWKEGRSIQAQLGRKFKLFISNVDINPVKTLEHMHGG